MHGCVLLGSVFIRRRTHFSESESLPVALWDNDYSQPADQRSGIWYRWERLNMSPVAEAEVHFEMLISFPVKPGMQEELRGKGTFFSPMKVWIQSIHFNFQNNYLLCSPQVNGLLYYPEEIKRWQLK